MQHEKQFQGPIYLHLSTFERLITSNAIGMRV